VIEIRDFLIGVRALQEAYAVATENKEHFETNTRPHSLIQTRNTPKTVNRL